MKRRDTTRELNLPIHWVNKRDGHKLEEWDVARGLITDADWDQGSAQLTIKLPRSLDRASVHRDLVLIVDFSGAKDNAGDLDVPCYLGKIASSRLKPEELALIRLVDPQPVRFKKR